MKRALEAVWLLVSHPLRSDLSEASRRAGGGVYDDHGAARATKRRRRSWWALQLAPAGVWAALALWRIVDGELALGIAYLGGALALAITAMQIRTAYLTGFLRGGLQVAVDARARQIGRPHDVSSRATPHPADPLPDVRGIFEDDDD